MAPKPSTRPPGTGTGDAEVTRIVSLNELAAKVDALVSRVSGGSGDAPGGREVSRETHEGGSIDEQVNRAVAAARERDAQLTAEEERRKGVDDRIKALEQRTEKRPSEVRPLTRWLWGSDE